MRNFDTRLSPGNSTINNHQVNVTWISSHTAVYEKNPNKKIIIVTDIKFPSFDCSVYDGFLRLSRIGSFMFKLGDSFNRTQTFVWPRLVFLRHYFWYLLPGYLAWLFEVLCVILHAEPSNQSKYSSAKYACLWYASLIVAWWRLWSLFLKVIMDCWRLMKLIPQPHACSAKEAG